MARIPAQAWREADRSRDNAAIARALGFDIAKLPSAWYALLPFVLIETDDGPVVAGTDEPPLPFGEPADLGELWYDVQAEPVPGFAIAAYNENRGYTGPRDIEPLHEAGLVLPFLNTGGFAMPPHCRMQGPSDGATVFALDAGGRIDLLGERHAHALYLPPRAPDQSLQLFTDGRSFFRAWVAARIAWVADWRKAQTAILAELPERADGCVPGALLIGDARAVRWPQDRVFVCTDAPTAHAVETGIRRSARMSEVILAPRARKAA